ncbi:hypothetical protein CJO76_05495 [Ralstonia solanacearum]|nr:hypothetical protein CJO76_05495 [Ralstonia solanacearum]
MLTQSVSENGIVLAIQQQTDQPVLLVQRQRLPARAKCIHLGELGGSIATLQLFAPLGFDSEAVCLLVGAEHYLAQHVEPAFGPGYQLCEEVIAFLEGKRTLLFIRQRHDAQVVQLLHQPKTLCRGQRRRHARLIRLQKTLADRHRQQLALEQQDGPQTIARGVGQDLRMKPLLRCP